MFCQLPNAYCKLPTHLSCKAVKSQKSDNQTWRTPSPCDLNSLSYLVNLTIAQQMAVPLSFGPIEMQWHLGRPLFEKRW